ncbi:MAG: DUF481 domain-containing protein [Gammaproteobacteria bacterium]|nr:DUF481 domain-containing protein [Gammaproteobacteria bacterium]
MNFKNLNLITKFALLISILLSQQALADKLILKNGSTLIGTIISKQNDTLEFKTPYAGTIMVNLGNIVEIESDKPLKLMLKDKTIKQVKHLLVEDKKIKINGSQENIQLSDMQYINPKPWQIGQSYKRQGAVNLALEFKEGNTKSQNVKIDGKLGFRGMDDRFTFSGQVENNESEQVKTANNWLFSAKYDYFFHKKSFLGVSAIFESDKIAELDLKQVYGVHLGHQYFESESLNLSINAGLAQSYEDNFNVPQQKYLSGTWELDYEQFILAGVLQYYHRQLGLYSFENSDDYSIKTWTGFKFPLKSGFSLSTEAQINYDNKVVSGNDKIDSTYLLKLGYDY